MNNRLGAYCIMKYIISRLQDVDYRLALRINNICIYVSKYNN